MIVKPVTVPVSATSTSSCGGRLDDAHRAVPLAGHVHPPARRALVPDDATVEQRVDVALEDRRELLGVGERHEVLHHERSPWAAARTSLTAPAPRLRGRRSCCCARRASAAARACPCDISSMLPASTACTIAVSAPSGCEQRERERMSQRVLGAWVPTTHVHDCDGRGRARLRRARSSASPVFGSYSQRRHEHLAVAGADAENAVLPQPGQERRRRPARACANTETRACWY